MKPGFAPSLFTFLLAGWCSILPVLVQACPCSLAAPDGVEEIQLGNRAEPAPVGASSCCGRCVPAPVSVSNGASVVEDDLSGESCRCGDVLTFQLFPVEAFESERAIELVLSIDVLPSCLDDFRSCLGKGGNPPPLVLSHQRKLAILGVWRL